jgi:hypothetical protein
MYVMLTYTCLAACLPLPLLARTAMNNDRSPASQPYHDPFEMHAFTALSRVARLRQQHHAAPGVVFSPAARDIRRRRARDGAWHHRRPTAIASTFGDRE